MIAKTLLRASRPSFLVLAPACVLLGIGAGSGAPVDVERSLSGAGTVVVALIAAVLAHLSVNALNEWSDFRSGLDLDTVRTPFSGGSGALPEHPRALGAVLALGLTALAAVLLAGLWFAANGAVELLPLGALGVFLVVTYTDLLNRNPWTCLVAPGAGFGLVMVPGAAWLFAGGYTATAWWASLVPFFQVNNLLLLNQYPDIEADRAAGRRHLLIVHGERAGAIAYALFVLATHAVVIVAILLGVFPVSAALALLPASLGWPAAWAAWHRGRQIARAPRYLAFNVIASVATPVVLGVTLLLAGGRGSVGA